MHNSWRRHHAQLLEVLHNIDLRVILCDNWDTMPKRKNRTMTDVLRQAIIDSGLPMLTLSKQTGVARGSLIRFVNGERSLRLDCADKLARFFRLRLIDIDAK